MGRHLDNKRTMTRLLRDALARSDSLLRVARETGTQRASLQRFRDEMQSLRLDIADRLAKYFNIESRHIRRKGE